MGDIADWYFDQMQNPFNDGGEYDERETITCELIKETDKALLVEAKRGQFWIPKSVGDYDDGVLTFQDWFVPKYLPKQVDHSDGVFGKVGE